MKLVYYAYGREDFVVRNPQQLKGTLGGHTWVNWRAYFHDFAPRLFR